MFSASGELIVDSRYTTSSITDQNPPIIPRTLDPTIWSLHNLKGNAIILVAHFFLGIALLTLIELDVISYFSWCPGIGCRAITNSRIHDLKKDDDVHREEERVAAQSSKDSKTDCIRVENF